MKPEVRMSFNPQKNIGTCSFEGDNLIIEFNDSENIQLGMLTNIGIGELEVLEYKNEHGQIIKRFRIKSLTIGNIKTEI